MRFTCLLAAVAFAGCATTSSASSPLISTVEEAPVPVAEAEATPFVDLAPPPMPAPEPLVGNPMLTSRATSLVGVPIKRVAPWLPDDCTGLARAVYEPAGVDLMTDGVPGDNGVTAIHRVAQRVGALHTNTPQPGDLVFFRETYDRNRDGLRNDGLTHIAVVESVSTEGDVVFVHRGAKGVERSKMNVIEPLSRERNDILRVKSKKEGPKLTGELFVDFAAWSKMLAPKN
ncbi:MAG: CHAP domain-containing protein [Archangium sp.]